MKQIKVNQYDAFSRKPHKGNPAGVECPTLHSTLFPTLFFTISKKPERLKVMNSQSFRYSRG
ncbi:hypothetical protein A2U94_06400 [Bacillus sp. VT 712]|uniref:hypothetical protein n=1 Tax=Priestia flexa TaxID=86664 RepID=UPI000473AA76|nr:hypothetical protein A2U94_06400 [Bacillus sp. VT 712]